MAFSIAIDGPAGAGKSTIAKELAKRLSFVYVDTGAMYRAIGLYLLRNQISPKDENSVEKACKEIQISISYEDGVQQVFLNGENVSEEIRKEEVGNMASAGAKNRKVREKLVELQRELASKADVVMDGRDIGTKVLPGAFFKIFMTASSSVRAKRRYDELIARGVECDYNTILSDIEHRDYEDENRELAPLKQASDAIVIDTSDMTIEEASDKITELFKNKKEEYERNHKG